MQIVLYVLGIVVGIFCLVFFGNLLVDAASAVARKLKISPLIIGLTVVALGTSLPELAVSVFDAIACLTSAAGTNANVALGNVIGSNICNILLVLGVSVLVKPITVHKSVCRREMPILLGISGLVVLFVFFGGNRVTITRWEAAILVLALITYIICLVRSAKRQEASGAPIEQSETAVSNAEWPWWKAILWLVVGAAGIIVGGEIVVYGAKGIAAVWASALHLNQDLAESLIGLTVVAVGTSLPELVTSAVAARKGQNDLAIGNVIGSNILNLLCVLGVSGVISPLSSGSQIIIDVLVMLWTTVIVFLFCCSGRLKRWHGAILLATDLAYITYLVVRTITIGV